MTQLLDPEGPYQCIWDDTIPCELVLIDVDRPATDQELMEFVFNNDMPPLAPVPLPAPALMLIAGIAMLFIWRRRNDT